MAVKIQEKNPIRRALNFLAKMGLTVRDDPPRVIDVAARQWGPSVDGFALPIETIAQEEGELLRFCPLCSGMWGTLPKRCPLRVGSYFPPVQTTAEPTLFGRELLKPERQTMRVTSTLAPGEFFETQLPVGSLFDLRARGDYPAQVSCTLPDGATLLSNKIAIRV